MSATTNAIASSSKLPKTKSKSKPDKQPKANGSSSHKRDKGANGVKDKGKSSSGKKSKKGHEGPYEHRRMRMRLSVPPKFSGDYMVGVREQLDGMVMHYVDQVKGVLLAHWDHTFLDESVNLINECPFGVADVEFETLIWAPKLGQKLHGTHSLSSPSHLSLLFSRTFNVSIPLQHIPQDEYEFQATNPDDLDDEDEDSDSEDGLVGLGGLNGHGQVEEVGRWKLKSTGTLVGEGGQGIRFTVIGMQVTNQMLSLTGSLLSDPTNPPPPPPAPTATQATVYDSPTPEPELERRPAKQARTNVKQPRVHAAAAAAVVQEEPKEEIDESFMTERELKQKRKEDARRKRDAKKEKKAGQAMIVEQALGGTAAVGMSGTGNGDGAKKRKGDDGEGGAKKKRKD